MRQALLLARLPALPHPRARDRASRRSRPGGARRARLRPRARGDRARPPARGAAQTRCRRAGRPRSTPRCAPRARPAQRIPELERMEREVALGLATAFDLHYRLRPRLRADRDRAPDGPARDRPRREPGGRAARARRRRLGDRPRRPRAAARAVRRRPRHRLAPARRLRAGSALMELAQVQEHATRILDEVERAVVGKRERARARPDGAARRRARVARGLSGAREDARGAVLRRR